MRPLSVIGGIALVSLAGYAFAVLPGGGATSASGTGRTGANVTGLSRTNLLCAELIGSGFFGNVLTVAPMSAAPATDPDTAIQFGKIWSDTNQATVGGAPSTAAPHAKPVVATVTLPIVFSAADRQRFEEAGWKPRRQSAGLGITYCLENLGRQEGGGSSSKQGMICVTSST